MPTHRPSPSFHLEALRRAGRAAALLATALAAVTFVALSLMFEPSTPGGVTTADPADEIVSRRLPDQAPFHVAQATFVAQDVLGPTTILTPPAIVRGECGLSCGEGRVRRSTRRVRERYWYRAAPQGHGALRKGGCVRAPCTH